MRSDLILIFAPKDAPEPIVPLGLTFRETVADLFMISPNWNQSKCLSKGEWIKCGAVKKWNRTQQRKGMN